MDSGRKRGGAPFPAALRENRAIDWQKRQSARAKMRMMVKRLLKKRHYPPEGMEDAVKTVIEQRELWTDNNDMEKRQEVPSEQLANYDPSLPLEAEDRVPREKGELRNVSAKI